MNNENFETCKSIALTLEKILNSGAVKCPTCGEIIAENEIEYSEKHDVTTCPCCGGVFDIDDVEQYGLYDYFSDALDVEYYSGGRGADDYRGVRIMIACGGPNIYVDTKRGRVELHWWTEYADYFLDDNVVSAIDDYFESYWNY